MDKGDFLGRGALEQRGAPARRLACLVLDEPDAVVLGSEPVRVDGRPLGRVTSGGYGYSVDASIAYAYLPATSLEPGTRVSVGVFGRDVPATVMREPLYDAANAKVRG